MSMSLDGFVAGPDQSPQQPIGRGGMALHYWHLHADEPDYEAGIPARDELLRPMGAYVMGRNMFGPIRGPWDGDWRGWWGDEPPYHAPVFVLTHHARESIDLSGGTTFHFVTDGFDAALSRAKDAAGDMDVDIAGGASAVRQALAADVLDDLYLDIVPVLVGSGESMFSGLSALEMTPEAVTHSPHATHVHYTIGHGLQKTVK
jgi:dihydrofolate reductase